jgi:RimJ/RimL family protein N-acetyltransferase
LAILPELETPRLTLRRLTLDDVDFVVRLLNEPSFLEYIGDRGVRNVDDARRYLRDGPFAMYQSHGFGLWHVANKTDGESIGMCGLLKRDTLPDVDLGYAYLPASWGRGFALEAAAATLRHAACKFGLMRVVAVVSPGNAASIRLLEKLGMRFERMHRMNPGEDEVRLYGRTLEDLLAG